MIKFKICFVSLIVTFVAMGMSSCSNDDKDPDFSSGKTCKISKVLFENGWSFYNFVYDSQNRILSYMVGDEGEESDQKISFEYGANIIVERNDTYKKEIMRYYLENGVITKMIDEQNNPDQEITLEYDSNNQLIKVGNLSGDDWTIVWKDGNIESISYSENNNIYGVSKYEYTSYDNTLSLFDPDTSSEYFEPELVSKGYFGKVSKNLLSKRIDSNNYTYKYSYSGFNSEGYPSTVYYTTMEYGNTIDEERIDLFWN